MAVSGEDVLVAGWMLMETEIAPNSFLIAPVAVIWKNGAEPVPLADPRTSSTASGIAIDGGSIYVAGYVATSCTAPCSAPYIAMVWKDGVALPLTTGKRGAVATSIAVDNGVIYAAGLQDNGTVGVATLWAAARSVGLGKGRGYGVGNAVEVAGWSVYVAGLDPEGPRYWKDGVAVPLGDFGGEALGLDVVVRGVTEEPPQLPPEPAALQPALATRDAAPAFLGDPPRAGATSALFGEPSLRATALAGAPPPPYRSRRATAGTFPSGPAK